MDYTQQQVGRASAILTTLEVAGNALKLERCKDKQITVDFSFTLGSLTNVTVYFYVSMDNSTYDPIYAPDGSLLEQVLTADTEACWTLPRLAGWKWFRMSVKGSGTATSSLCDYTYRYDLPGSE